MSTACTEVVDGAIDRVARLVTVAATGWCVGDTHRGAGVDELAEALYARWYTEPATNAPPRATDPALHHHSLHAALRAAHAGAARHTSGWVVTGVKPSGAVKAMHGRSGRWIEVGDYVNRARPGVPPAPGEAVDVTARLDELDSERGLWWAFSDPPPRDPLGRVYLNVRAQTSPRVVHEITSALDDFAYRLKCPVLPGAYRRVDAMVLYHERDDRQRLLDRLLDRWATLGPLLDPDVPPLTGRVRPGLAVADELGGGKSYGENRCLLVAEAILRHRDRWAEPDPTARHQVLAAALDEAGAGGDEPWRERE